MKRRVAIALGCMLALAMRAEALAQASADAASMLCERAARDAERGWHLPQGLLTAIGLVESGRWSAARTFQAIWPWTINAEGQGYYEPSKAAAIAMVRALRLRGARAIDVGCFQVDLLYHPYAFVSLEEAFDPDVNARVAAHILSLGRSGIAGWDGAIATYHSAAPALGTAYLQRVRAVWRQWAAALPSWGTLEPPEVYAALLSAQARLVRVVTPFDARDPVQWLSDPPANLPRVLSGKLNQ
jgi:hypothetical protein